MKWILFAALAGLGCSGSTGLDLIRYPLTGHGQSLQVRAGDWDVTVEEARIGFGPLYLCAAMSASADLCETAVSEFASSAAVDGLGVTAQPLGEIVGFTGTVHSALFDYGYSWLAGNEPMPQPAAPGGHSAQMRVIARKADRTLQVTADVDVLPGQRADLAVRMHVPATAQTSASHLDVTFDVAAWWQNVDFDALAMLGDAVTIPAEPPAVETDPAQEDANRIFAGVRSALLTAMTSTKRPTLVCRP